MKTSYRGLLLIGAMSLLSACNEPADSSKASTDDGTALTPKQQVINLPAVDFRVAQEPEGKGLYTLTLPELTLHYLPTPVLSRADLADATPMRTEQGQAYVSLRFTSKGAEKLSRISRQYQGMWLIFTINNELIGLPRLENPVTDGVLNLTMSSEQRAVQVVAAIGGN